MSHCENKVGGACTRDATWQQIVHAGDREAGAILYRSYWCDEHAAAVAEKRRRRTGNAADAPLGRVGSYRCRAASDRRREDAAHAKG